MYTYKMINFITKEKRLLSCSQFSLCYIFCYMSCSVRKQSAMANQKKEDFSLKETKPAISAKRSSIGPTTSFDLVEEMLYLYVKIEKARHLPVFGNPQVELKIGNYRGVTRPAVKNGQEEFKWYQTFAFTKDRLQDTSVQVLVKDAGNVIGKFNFGVSEALKRVPPDPPLAAQWFPLLDQKGNAFGGELMLAFWTGTQADEVYNVAWHSDAAAALSHEGLLSIRSKVHYSPKLWYLRVNVVAAQDLVIKDMAEREQPPQIFVQASLPHSKWRSNASSTKTANPKWNEDLMFVVAEPFDDALVVEVSEQVEKDALLVLGSCRIPLKSVGKRNDNSAAASLWYDLKVMEGEEKNLKFASKINMRISLDGGYHVQDEPTDFASDLRPSAKILWKQPVGVLELGIVSASGLSPMKPKTSVDAFCVAKYGPKWVRTRTIIDNCSPKWNEQYMWDVYDHCTVITVAVFENKYLHNGGGIPDWEIGKIRIRLSNLEFGKVYTNYHPIVGVDSSGVKKRGEVQLSIRFSCPSTFNVFHRYLQPLWPKLHYILPLSVNQILRLRGEAVELTASRLRRAESPLSCEVVHHLLDDNKYRFSVRRGRANYRRCVELFQCLLSYKHRFDQLRKWTNPWHNCVFVILLFLVTWYPSRALASMFFVFSGLGAWGYWKRPRQLPHIDTELSLACSVDELAEEFDFFPKNGHGDILLMRYNRLRKIGVNIQTTLGDIATTGERVQSLLSGRDMRATLMVVVFSIFAGLLFFINPCPVRYLVFCAICWVIRPPNVRIGLPPYFLNFIRRMPSKIDSML